MFWKANVTASKNRSFNPLTEVEEPAEIVHRSGQALIATDPFCLHGLNTSRGRGGFDEYRSTGPSL